jgi:hypothetical protein
MSLPRQIYRERQTWWGVQIVFLTMAGDVARNTPQWISRPPETSYELANEICIYFANT